tara:strand:+ start:1237 stop:1398 length:162 start_codon:yes stop_codon:yes gene_type:complete
MKLRKNEREPLLRLLLGKDTPKLDLDDERRMKIEQKILGLPPKKDRDSIIVPN